LKRAKHNRLLIEERMLQYIRYLNFKVSFFAFPPWLRHTTHIQETSECALVMSYDC